MTPPAALAAYDKKLRDPISQVVLRNRGAGPFGQHGGRAVRRHVDNIGDVIPPMERAEVMAGYKAAAGFAIDSLNKAPRTIAEGARVRAAQAAPRASRLPDPANLKQRSLNDIILISFGGLGEASHGRLPDP